MIRLRPGDCADFADNLIGVCHAPYRWLDVNVQGWLECVDETPFVPAEAEIRARDRRLFCNGDLRFFAYTPFRLRMTRGWVVEGKVWEPGVESTISHSEERRDEESQDEG